MASTPAPTETKDKISSALYIDKPVEYCQNAYRKAKVRNDKLMPINIENALFYEGIDKKLQELADDRNVVRSALFIPILKPAIDTIISGPISRLDQYDCPVTVRPRDPNADAKTFDRALAIEKAVNRQLRDSGYLSDGFREHILAAEIQRTPSAIKVGWTWDVSDEPEIQNPTLAQSLVGMLRFQIPKPKVKFNQTVKGRPYVQWVYPDEFLYQPDISNFYNDSEYAIHAVWLTYDEIMGMAQLYRWKVDVIEKYYKEVGSGKATHESESVKDAYQDKIQAGRDTASEEGYRDGKFLITETYVRLYDESGYDNIYCTIMIGNKYIIRDKHKPYRRKMWPFVVLTTNQIPGTLESLSSVDIGKPYQRLYNALGNSYLDGISYRMFPPFKAEKTLKFDEQPRWALGAIWRVSKLDGIVPVIENPGPLPEIRDLMESYASRMREALNAPDISQGFISTQYEKATATNYRASGSAQRSVPKNKQYGQVLVKVAECFIALNQQYAEDATEWALDVVVDVPGLTSTANEDEEKQEAILLLNQAMQDPVYQTPIGQVKLNNLRRDVMLKFKRNDIDRYVPTDEEIKQIVGAVEDAKQAQLKKQSALEQLQFEQSMQTMKPPMMGE